MAFVHQRSRRLMVVSQWLGRRDPPPADEWDGRASGSAVPADASDLRLDHRARCPNRSLDQGRINAREGHLRSAIPARLNLTGLLSRIYIDEPLCGRPLGKRPKQARRTTSITRFNAKREIEGNRSCGLVRRQNEFPSPALQT